MKYESVIGLEVHVELKRKPRFSAAAARNSAPNQYPRLPGLLRPARRPARTQ